MTNLKKQIEVHKPIPGFDGLYSVSTYGNVFSHIRNRLISGQPAGKGYMQSVLTKNKKQTSHYIHRLVASTFLPNPQNKPHVNHIDGNPFNNHLSNLEWCTAKENIHHALKTGLFKGKKVWITDVVKMKVGDEIVTYSVPECNSLCVAITRHIADFPELSFERITPIGTSTHSVRRTA